MNYDPWSREFMYTDAVWDCLDREHATIDTIVQRLIDLGFQSNSEQRYWRFKRKKIVVYPVDDVLSLPVPWTLNGGRYIFDDHTTVITDNILHKKTHYEVINLPRSFFGIYYHESQGQWQPDREYCYSINRIDNARIKLLLDLCTNTDLASSYVNFNCQNRYYRTGAELDVDKLKQNFLEQWQCLDPAVRDRYHGAFLKLKDQMPFKNYNISHTDAHLRSWCNIVVETYNGDDSAALSEKIFRAMALPVPWVLFGGRDSIKHLETFGFDLLEDVMHHRHYDSWSKTQDRTPEFIAFVLDAVDRLRGGDFAKTARRCREAAEHNKSVLRDLHARWPEDFQQWCEQHLSKKSSIARWCKRHRDDETVIRRLPEVVVRKQSARRPRAGRA